MRKRNREMTRNIDRRLFLGMLAAGSIGAAEAAGAKGFRTLYKYGKLVLAAAKEPAAFDAKSVDCPFVFQHDGQFHMTYVGYDGTGYQTGLASSRDLMSWTKLGCIFPRDPKSPYLRYNAALNWIVRENAMHSPGKLKRIHGRFLGVYHAYPNAGLEQGAAVIGLCWSDDLRHWEAEEPALHPEEGAFWERGGLYKPCLVEHKGTYYLFYNAKTPNLPKDQGGGWREQTGVATSKDLKHWKRYEGNPIVPNGGAGSWDERFASDPCVVQQGGAWALFYYGLDKEGKARDLLALGRDLFHFAKVEEILIDTGAPGTVDSTYAHKPSVVYHDGALYHFYCAVAGKHPQETRGISVARSRRWA